MTLQTNETTISTAMATNSAITSRVPRPTDSIGAGGTSSQSRWRVRHTIPHFGGARSGNTSPPERRDHRGSVRKIVMPSVSPGCARTRLGRAERGGSEARSGSARHDRRGAEGVHGMKDVEGEDRERRFGLHRPETPGEKPPAARHTLDRAEGMLDRASSDRLRRSQLIDSMVICSISANYYGVLARRY
jgi:hypothetical protein